MRTERLRLLSAGGGRRRGGERRPLPGGLHRALRGLGRLRGARRGGDAVRAQGSAASSSLTQRFIVFQWTLHDVKEPRARWHCFSV
jgi:hypothetical protein